MDHPTSPMAVHGDSNFCTSLPTLISSCYGLFLNVYLPSLKLAGLSHPPASASTEASFSCLSDGSHFNGSGVTAHYNLEERVAELSDKHLVMWSRLPRMALNHHPLNAETKGLACVCNILIFAFFFEMGSHIIDLNSLCSTGWLKFSAKTTGMHHYAWF